METAMNNAMRELLYDDTVSEQQLKRNKADRKDEPDDTVDAFSVASTDSGEDDEDNDNLEQEKVTTSMTKMKEEHVSQLQGTKIDKAHPQEKFELNSVASKRQQSQCHSV